MQVPYQLKNGKTIDLLNIQREDLLDDSVSDEEAMEIRDLLQALVDGAAEWNGDAK